MKRRILLIAPGDPRHPKTWSGTPYHLSIELEKRDALAGAISTTEVTSQLGRAAAAIASSIYYQRRQLLGYGRFLRMIKGRSVARAIATVEAPAALHLMTTHLPLIGDKGTTRHYLYLDTSQRLWSRYSDLRHRRSGNLERDVHLLERRAFAQMEHIFTISAYLRDDLINHYGVAKERVSAVGSGLGSIAPWMGPKDYSNGAILYVGLDWEAKGGQLTLEAFSLARRERPHLCLTMVCEKAAQQRLLKLQIPGVKPLTQISWDQLQQLYREASLFVMPALHQPWGLAYLEALSCAVPIVGLARLSTPELNGNGLYGWSLNSQDPRELAAVMITAADHPSESARMGKEGQQFCLDRFGWDKTVDRIVQKVSAGDAPPIGSSLQSSGV